MICKDAVFLINFRRRDRDAGIVVADDEFDAVGGKLVRDRHALLRIGNVVAVGDADFLAENAAGGVDVGSGLVHAILHLSAGCGAWPGDRAADAEFDLGRGCSGR